MTVKELIDLLATLPQDFTVIYQCCSDYSVLEADSILVQKDTDELKLWVSAIPHHNMTGVFRRYDGSGVQVKPSNVVIFPGN